MWSVLLPGFVLLLATLTWIAIWLIDSASSDDFRASNDEHNGPHDPFF